MSPHRLFKNEQIIDRFFDSILFGVLIVDENSRITALNEACLDILSLSSAEIKQRAFPFFLDPKSKDVYLDSFSRLVDGDTKIEDEVLELSLVNTEDILIPIELTFNTTLHTSDGLFILIINDITRRKQLEEKIKIQRKETAEIEDELEKEQSLSELKSRFVTMASHEFRTPLAGVLSSVNLIERYFKAEEANGVELTHKSKIENHFGKIKESVNNLTTILNEFLSLGKLEEGKIKCHWEEINLVELASRQIDELQKLCKKGQRILTENELDQSIFILDHLMISNIINNLISNAIKYSNENGFIRLKLGVKDEDLIIQVSDEGIGIPQTDQKKLFGRFFRAQNTVNIQGTGLGLNIVKKYVEMMNGRIDFESELNKGTTFTVQIPIKNGL
jgi:PAS domain S-box-containing protein